MKRIYWLIPLLAVLAGYWMAPGGDLVWDDPIVVRQQLISFRTLGDVLQPPPGIPQWSYDYYRPTVIMSYVLDAKLFGLGNAPGAHLMNVIWHLLTTFFAWRLLLGLLPGRKVGAALGAAVLFAVHPIHTESVSWITGRSDLLATMFLLPALLAALAWRDARWGPRGSALALLLSPALFLAALLAKEVALAGLLILPLALLVRDADANGQRPPLTAKRWLPLVAGWLAATGVYLWLRLAAGTAGGATVGTWPALSLDYVVLPLRALAWYLQKLVLPWPQSNFVVWDAVPGLGLALAVLLPAAILFGYSARRWFASGDGTLLLAGWWIAVSIAPTLAITLVAVSETPVAERSLYLPSVGAALAAGVLLSALLASPRARLAAAGTALVALGYLAGTIERGFTWSSDLRLWSDAAAKAPAHGIPWIEVGKARAQAGDNAGAREAFEHALGLDNSPKVEAIGHYNVGLMDAQTGNLAGAERHFTEAIRANPAYHRGQFGLGRILVQRAMAGDRRYRSLDDSLGQVQAGVTALRQSVALSATFVDGYLALAQALLAQGDLRRELGDLAGGRQRHQEALAQLNRAVQVDGTTPQRPEFQGLSELARLRLGANAL